MVANRVALRGETADRIEALLSARLFLEPQLADDRLYFISNLGGALSLYAMDADGGVPEPLLPPRIALQNPELMAAYSFYVFPELEQILVMLDHNGDEKYKPYVIPLEGGFPEPIGGDSFDAFRSQPLEIDNDGAIAYFLSESLTESMIHALRLDLASGRVDEVAKSQYGAFAVAWNSDHSRVVLGDEYVLGDVVLWEPDGNDGRKMIYGTPIEEREEGREYPRTGFKSAHLLPSGKGMLMVSTVHDDKGAAGYLPLDGQSDVEPVEVDGVAHSGEGEFERLQHLDEDRYAAIYNIDGCSWAYDARFDEAARRLTLERMLVGQGELADGVLHGLHFDRGSGRFTAAFCTATMPTQLYVLDENATPVQRTRERALGLAPELLAAGEDASYDSHDGLRVSARLYLPSDALGYEGARPLVYYVHGGPQSQERPNFAWFSMPLIQALTLNGFAVFVPNVRGSTGYGAEYAQRVDRDWGGNDRLDHVFAMKEVLPKDDRIDVDRAGVIGRSYGGYMTLTLAGRHPELWRGAVDMFGSYDLVTWASRVPETWKPFIELAIGDPEKDREFLVERSASTYVDDIACPLLVIQGQNDPRVVEQESRDLVDHLRGEGKDVDYLVFEDEGHDVLKLPNRVRCYETITQFFSTHLGGS